MENHQMGAVMTVSVERAPSQTTRFVSDPVSSYTYNRTYICRRANSCSPVTQVVEEIILNPRAHQGDSGDARRDVIDHSDSDASLDLMVRGLHNHVHCACCQKPIRQLVFGLLGVRLAPDELLDARIARSPIRLGVRSREDIDRANRAAYMRNWQARAKRQRVEARDLARQTPRRFPRFSSSSVSNVFNALAHKLQIICHHVIHLLIPFE